MNNFNIDQTIEYVKNIIDNVQCPLCDKFDGQRMRFSCGHTACNNCVFDAKECQICLTPDAISTEPIPDNALTQRVKHASILHKACQNLYTDVFQRKRLSEQLRTEKELFPKCIQAPVKYENKRKSAFHSSKNKENRCSTIFPGEEISNLKENMTMENSVNYVQQWLNKNNKDFSRKPFRDLNVNTQVDSNFKRKQTNSTILSNKDENIPVFMANSKNSHYKTIVKNYSTHDRRKSKVRCNNKKGKNEFNHAYKEDECIEAKKRCNNDESGIFMDNDFIVIEDSQDTVNDKDKNAWLSVLEANKNEELESTSLVNLDYSDAKSVDFTNKVITTKHNQLQIKDKKDGKVPFYKRSYITETCKFCNTVVNMADSPSPKEVKITIDNDNFTTTINIFNNVKYICKLHTTNSVSVQTDTCETVVKPHEYGNYYDEHNGYREKTCGVGKNSQKSDAQSEDLFDDEGKNVVNEYSRNICKVLVIEESDSDIDMEKSGPIPVKVDVHRSCEELEYGVLGEIENHEEYNTRKRRGPRGLTPTSTDSSEKENFNPNRVKQHIPKKKKVTKK